MKSIKINDNTHLTFITPEGRFTFGQDNAEDFPIWWKHQYAKLINLDKEYFIVLHKREFTLFKTDDGMPIKKISCCFMQGDSIIPMKAEQSRKAFNTDAKTGKSLPALKDHIFVDFEF